MPSNDPPFCFVICIWSVPSIAAIVVFTLGFIGARDRSEIAVGQCAIKQGSIDWGCVKDGGENGCQELGWQVSLCGSVYTKEGLQMQTKSGAKDCIPLESDSWRDSGDYDFDDNDRYITV